MKSTRMLSAAIGHSLVAIVLLGLSASCGGSGQQRGVTNMQPVDSLAPGQCLSRGTACTVSTDCCSQWCANGRCATQQP